MASGKAGFEPGSPVWQASVLPLDQGGQAGLATGWQAAMQTNPEGATVG